MSLETQITALVTAIATDIKTLSIGQGDLSTLTTTAKSNLVAALNELSGKIGSSGASINDSSAVNATATTYSANKINNAIAAAVSALVAGSPGTLDTLKELADALGDDPAFATTVATSLANRVRFDASQSLTAAQQLQACTNIGVGDPTHNWVNDYTTAKS